MLVEHEKNLNQLITSLLDARPHVFYFFEKNIATKTRLHDCSRHLYLNSSHYFYVSILDYKNKCI